MSKIEELQFKIKLLEEDVLFLKKYIKKQDLENELLKDLLNEIKEFRQKAL